jgi:hypothetical protein
VWNGQDGQWFVPPIDARVVAHSGTKAIVNEWGDPRMALAFAARTDVAAVWAAGHGGAAASAVRFIGWRGGSKAHESPRIPLGAAMQRCALDFRDVDRLELVIEPAGGAQGWLALDDLELQGGGRTRVLDFEDLPWRHVLTGTGYAGIAWERGTGLRAGGTPAVHAPLAPLDAADEPDAGGGAPLGGASAATPSSPPCARATRAPT